MFLSLSSIFSFVGSTKKIFYAYNFNVQISEHTCTLGTVFSLTLMNFKDEPTLIKITSLSLFPFWLDCTLPRKKRIASHHDYIVLYEH